MNGNVCMPALHIVPSHASIKPVDEQRSRVVKNCNLQPRPHQPPLLHHVVQVYTSRASAIKQWDKYVAPDEQRAQRITDDGGPTAPVEAQGRGQGEPDPAGRSGISESRDVGDGADGKGQTRRRRRRRQHAE